MGTDVSLGGKKSSGDLTQSKQKMIYLNVPTAISMIIELGDSKNIKKYADPIIASMKQSLTNKELSKVLCTMFGVKTNKKFSKTKPNEFKMMTDIFGDIWGLKK